MQNGKGNLQIGRIPEVPKGGGAIVLLSSFLNMLIRCINGFRVISVVIPGATTGTAKFADIKTTEFGTIITLPSGIASVPSTSSGSASQYKMVSDGGDYWNCKAWDGTTLSSTVTKVAKPERLRAGTGKVASKVIRGVTYTYTFTSVTVSGVITEYERGVTGSDGSAETERLAPSFLPGDIFVAIPFTTLSPSTLVDVLWIYEGSPSWAAI